LSTSSTVASGDPHPAAPPAGGPGAGPAVSAPTSPGPSGDAILDLVIRSLDDGKAEDIVTIPLAGKTSLADHMVIASGRSSRQVAAMAQHLLEKLKADCGFTAKVEGLPHGDWVLIDARDVIVHLFRPEVRTFYNLEKMWSIEVAPAARSA